MKKRITALLLALLCLSGTAACGQKTPAADTPDSSTEQPLDTQGKTETGGETAETPSGEASGTPVSGEAAAAPDPADNTAAAERYVNNLPLESQVAQMFFARCPETDAASLAGQYDIGGYILFGRDFEGQTPASVTSTIQSYQDAAATPMLIGVDEEGGTVVRISSSPDFRAVKFQSPQGL